MRLSGHGKLGNLSVGSPLISPGLPSLRLKEIVARAVVCRQASLAHNFDLDPVIAERVASGAAVAEGVLCV